MKYTPKPDNRRPYDAAFRAEALRLAAQSRSTQVAARALNIGPKRLYQWHKAAKMPVAAALGAALDLVPTLELRQLRAANWRQAQGLEILKKCYCPLPAVSASSRRHRTNEPLPLHRHWVRPLPGAAALPGVGRAGQRLLRLAGQDVYYPPPVEEFQATLKQSGVPDIYIGIFTTWASAVAQGMMDVEDSTLASFLGRKPTTMAQFITRVYN